MTNLSQQTPREASIEKGKRIVIAIIIYLILNEMVSFFLFQARPGMAFMRPVRWLSYLIFCYYLYQGKNWARSILAFFTGGGALLGAYGVYQAFVLPNASIIGLLFLLLFVTFPLAWSSYNLILSSDIDEFISSRKT